MQVTGKRAKFLDRLGIAIRGHTDPVFLSPHINAGGMRMEDGHVLRCGLVLLALFGHTCRQSGEERGEQEQTGLLRSKDTIVEGVLRAARLFHLERTKAQRWRDANTSLESDRVKRWRAALGASALRYAAHPNFRFQYVEF